MLMPDSPSTCNNVNKEFPPCIWLVSLQSSQQTHELVILTIDKESKETRTPCKTFDYQRSISTRYRNLLLGAMGWKLCAFPLTCMSLATTLIFHGLGIDESRMPQLSLLQKKNQKCFSSLIHTHTHTHTHIHTHTHTYTHSAQFKKVNMSFTINPS